MKKLLPFTIFSFLTVLAFADAEYSFDASKGKHNLPPLNVTGIVFQDTCGLGIGAVDLTVTGGTPPYSFVWSNGANTEDITVILGNSNYAVTVTDSNGEIQFLNFFVPNLTDIFGFGFINGNYYSTAAGSNNTACMGNPNGFADLTPLTNLPFMWNWSNGTMGEDIYGLAAGDYHATITLGNCLYDTYTTHILDIPDAPILNATVVPATCGQPNGSIDLSVTGSAPPYNYVWSNGANTEDLANLSPGFYNVTVYGSNGCFSTAFYTLLNGAGFSVTGSVSDASNCLGTNGAIDLTTPPGSYTFAWSNGASTEDLSGLSAGSYAVTVSDGGGCTVATSFTVQSTATPPTLSATATDATCGISNGSIDLTVTNGTPPFTYAWSNGASTEDLSNLATGSYTVTVTGADGCTASASATVGNTIFTPGITADIIPAVFCSPVSHLGSISLTLSPPNGSYTYAWSNGATTANISMLLSGAYTVTVSLGPNCNASATFNVPDISFGPGASYTVVDATCSENNGSINITMSPTGSPPPYTFAWSNGANMEDLSNVPAGNYSITITDINLCQLIVDFIVQNDNIPIPISGAVTPSTTCTGSNGSISVSSPPPGPYNYIWSNGATGSMLTGLASGTYSVTVISTGTCTGEASFTVPNIPNLPAIAFNPTAATCSLSNGQVTTSVTGGTAPYQYIWSNGETTPDLINLSGGSFSLTVTDALGCSVGASVTVPDSPISIGITGTTSPAPNGSVDITASPANGYTYNWSNGASTEDISGLAADTYIVTVSLGTGCTATASFVLGSFPPSITGVVTPDTCSLGRGSIDITVAGGVPPYTFTWSNGETTEDVSALTTGQYTVTVVDALGTSTTETYTVPDWTDISFYPYLFWDWVQYMDSTCIGPPTGAIIITPLSTIPFEWSWPNGSVGWEIYGLEAGQYLATVTAGVGSTCYSIQGFQIYDNPPVVNGTPTSAICGMSNGEIDITVSNGKQPYTFAWSNGANTEDLVGAPPGTYAVSVTDAADCTSFGLFTIGDIFPYTLDGTASPLMSCLMPDGSIDLTAAPPGSYTYQWSNGASTEDVSGLTVGSYMVTATNGIGCTATASFIIGEATLPPYLSSIVSTAYCGQSNGSVDLIPSGGATPYTFLWSNGTNTEGLSNASSGSYVVTVTGSNGCTATTAIDVPNSDIGIFLDANVTANTGCGSNNGSIVLHPTPPQPPSGNYAYLWSNGNTTPGLSSLSGGSYSVTVSVGTCTASATFTVANGMQVPALTSTATPAGCGSPGSVNLTVTGGSPPYGFLWSNAAATEDLPSVPPGSYGVTVTGADGCSASSSIIVPNNVGGADTTAISSTTCDPGSAGTFVQNLTGQGGCDSVIVTTVALLASDTVAIFDTSCDINDVGVFEQTLINGNGCDSLVITTIAYAAADTTNIFDTSCDINDVGVFEQTLVNINGCDSLIIKMITYAAADTTNILGSSCDINDVGVFEQTLTNNNGCDSLIITTTTYAAADTTNILGSSCDLNDVGVFEQTLANNNGCDSLIIITITYAAADTTTIFDTSCDINDVGVFEQTLANNNGCDSLIITTVVYAEADTTTLFDTSCDINAVGIFEQTLINGNGCDSLIITTVTYAAADTTNISSTSCDINDVGVSEQMLINTNGCDSLIITTVTYAATDTTNISGTSCDINDVGVSEETLTNINGCDSLVITTVILLPSATTILTASTCDPTQAGVFIQNLNTWQGCDSTVTTTVTLLPVATTAIAASTCDPTLAGVFIQNLSTWQGCDSTVTTTLTWTPPPTLTVSISDFNGFGVTCATAADGWAQASATGVPPFGFVWENGSSSPLMEGLAPGSYAVSVTDSNGCTAEGALEITGPEPLANSLSITALGCFDDNSGAVIASGMGGVPPYLYSLDSGPLQASGTFGGLGAGAYHITVQDANGCSATDLVAINAPVPLSVELGDDIFLELGDGTVLSALVNVPLDSLAQISWSNIANLECPGCPNQQVFPIVTTAYTVTVTDAQGCIASDGLTVYVDRTKNVYVPNAFSPNGDGINDLLLVFAKEGQVKKVKSFLVFDRWGESVFQYFDFQPNDPASGWDGSHRGQLLDAAVFVWYAEVEFVDGQVELFEGDVVLVR